MHNKFNGHFATALTALEYVISLTRWSLGCVRLLSHIYLTLTTMYCSKIPTPINQNKRMQSRLIRLIRVVFSNNAMLSVSDIYDSVNERTQEISESMKLHILGVRQNVHKFIRQPTYLTGDNNKAKIYTARYHQWRLAHGCASAE